MDKEKTTVEGKNTNQKSDVLKSLAKANGLKSSFVIGNEVVMTSFGRGNSAILEKKITGSRIENLNPNVAFYVKKHISDSCNPDSGKYDVKSKRMKEKAVVDDPVYVSPEKASNVHAGQDLIGCKNVLEERYFGKTFDDNIHIQLIYNILDIEKILAVHVSNATFAINNILGIEGKENEDFIGNLSVLNTFDEFENYETHPKFANKSAIKENLRKSKVFFDKIKKGNKLGYFGQAFYYATGTGKNLIFTKKSSETIYELLALVGSLRQFCVHDEVMVDNKVKSRSWLYNAQKELKPDFLKALDELYSKEVEKIDSDFIVNNTVDLHIIHDAIDVIDGSADWQKITNEYYDFIIRKCFKNIGFSIKRLRETMIEEQMKVLCGKCDRENCKGYGKCFKNKKYDSVRSRLNRIVDFIIFRHYNDEAILKNVSLLRTCMSEEEKQKRFYLPEAKALWKKYNYVFRNYVLKKLNGKSISGLKEKAIENSIDINSVKISLGDPDYFCKFIYLLTFFLDGKEINDLLTTLINKFDNIASFISVMKNDKLSIDCEFVPEYSFFANSAQITSDLRVINSFARMQAPAEPSKDDMYRDALDILGMDDLSEDGKKQLEDTVLCRDENGKYMKKEDNNPKRDTNFRNFLGNNVLASTRFKYLIRYNNAKKTRALANNKAVIIFMLNKINKQNPEQIVSYYKACRDDSDPVASDAEAKIEFLAEKIMNVSCTQFRYVKNGTKVRPDEAKEKERFKAIIGLYLTVMYLITKNMVYINSRYVTAFHCLERDSELHGVKFDQKKLQPNLTKKFIDPKTCGDYGLRNNKRARTYIEQNMDKMSNCTSYWNEYRNAVAHLSVIRNMNQYIKNVKNIGSCFELYHYIMQRFLLDKENIAESLREYDDFIKKKGCYRKDFVKALNTPFGYNLARYKNLSIAELFDRNDTELERTNKLRNEAIKADIEEI